MFRFNAGSHGVVEREVIKEKIVADNKHQYDIETTRLIASIIESTKIDSSYYYLFDMFEDRPYDVSMVDAYVLNMVNKTFDDTRALIGVIRQIELHSIKDKDIHRMFARLVKIIYTATTNQEIDIRMKLYIEMYGSNYDVAFKHLFQKSELHARMLNDILNVKINNTEFMVMMCKCQRKLPLPEPPSDDHVRYYMLENLTGTICRIFFNTTVEQKQKIIDEIDSIDGYSYMDLIAQALRLFLFKPDYIQN